MECNHDFYAEGVKTYRPGMFTWFLPLHRYRIMFRCALCAKSERSRLFDYKSDADKAAESFNDRRSKRPK